jgi:type VI protein secretion system component Hcp
MIGPIFVKIKQLNGEIKKKELGIKENLRILAHKDRIKDESAKYASFFKGPKSEEDVVSFLQIELEAMANKAKVYLVDIKPGGSKTAEGGISKYFVNLNCEAKMEQLVNFMHSIENSDSLLLIEKYRIGPKSKESSVATCSMSVSKIVIP